MKKIFQKISQAIIFRIVKPIELLFIIFTIFLLVYSLSYSDNIIDTTIKSNLAQNIIYAAFTATLTTIIMGSFNRAQKYLRNRKYLGYWMVLTYKNDDYTELQEYAQITLATNGLSSFEYTETNYASLDSISGKIFIDEQNESVGKLIKTYEWLGNVAGLYPVQLDHIYFDNETIHAKKMIRILTNSGKEIKVLCRPEKQNEFIGYVNNMYDETIEKKTTLHPSLKPSHSRGTKDLK